MSIPEEVLHDIKSHSLDIALDILPKAKNNSPVCPKCKNGSGPDGTGLELKGEVFKCFKCGFSGNIFQLISHHLNLPFIDAVSLAANSINLDISKHFTPGNKLKKSSNKFSKKFVLHSSTVQKPADPKLNTALPVKFNPASLNPKSKIDSFFNPKPFNLSPMPSRVDLQPYFDFCKDSMACFFNDGDSFFNSLAPSVDPISNDDSPFTPVISQRYANLICSNSDDSIFNGIANFSSLHLAINAPFQFFIKRGFLDAFFNACKSDTFVFDSNDNCIFDDLLLIKPPEKNIVFSRARFGEPHFDFIKNDLPNIPKFHDLFEVFPAFTQFIKNFNIGYDPFLNAIVFPHDSFSASRRAIQPADSNHRFFNIKNAQLGIFNWKNFNEDKPLFITESAIDALSIMFLDPNFQAVAFGGTGNSTQIGMLINGIQALRQDLRASVIIAFDFDKTGFNKANELKSTLETHGIHAVILNTVQPRDFFNPVSPDLPTKDINDLFCIDKFLLKKQLQRQLDLLPELRAAFRASVKALPVVDSDDKPVVDVIKEELADLNSQLYKLLPMLPQSLTEAHARQFLNSPRTEHDAAVLFTHAFTDYMFNSDTQSWFQYDGSRWVELRDNLKLRDKFNLVMQYPLLLAKIDYAVIRFNHYARIYLASKRELSTASSLIDSVASFFNVRKKNYSIQAVSELPDFNCSDADFDYDKLIFHTQNCSVDFLNPAIKPHQRTNLNTLIADVSVDDFLLQDLNVNNLNLFWKLHSNEVNNKINLIDAGLMNDSVINTLNDHWQRVKKSDLPDFTNTKFNSKCGSPIADFVNFYYHAARIYHDKPGQPAYFKPWDDFIKSALPDDSVREYLQLFIGYSMLGVTSEDVFFFIYGKGGTGKSTFVEVLRKLFGDYAATFPSEYLMKSNLRNFDDADKPSPQLAHMRHCRLALASETSKGCNLDVNKIKRWTGKDSIVVRDVFKTAFEFTPQFKILICGNYAPRIDNTEDDGLMRRLRIIPFDQKPTNVDTKLLDTLLTPKGLQAAFRWCLEGAFKFRYLKSQNINPFDFKHTPEPVMQHLKCFYNDNDNVYKALSDLNYGYNPSYNAKVVDIWTDYVNWCKKTRASYVDRNFFERRLFMLIRDSFTKCKVVRNKQTGLNVISNFGYVSLDIERADLYDAVDTSTAQLNDFDTYVADVSGGAIVHNVVDDPNFLEHDSTNQNISETVVDDNSADPIDENVVENVVENDSADPIVEDVVENNSANSIDENVVENNSANSIDENVVENNSANSIDENIVENNSADSIVENVVENNSANSIDENIVENNSADSIVENVSADSIDENFVENNSANSIDENVVENNSANSIDENIVENDSTDSIDENVVDDNSADSIDENVIENDSTDSIDENVVDDNSADSIDKNIVEDNSADSIDKNIVEDKPIDPAKYDFECTFANFKPVFSYINDDRHPYLIPDHPSIYNALSITNLPDVNPISRKYIEDDSLDDDFHKYRRAELANLHFHWLLQSVASEEFIDSLPQFYVDQLILKSIRHSIVKRDEHNLDGTLTLFKSIFQTPPPPFKLAEIKPVNPTNQNVDEKVVENVVAKMYSTKPTEHKLGCSFAFFKPIVKKIDDNRNPDDIPEQPSIYDVKSIANLPPVDPLDLQFVEDNSLNDDYHLRRRTEQMRMYFFWLQETLVNNKFIRSLPKNSIDAMILKSILRSLLAHDVNSNFNTHFPLFKSIFKPSTSTNQNVVKKSIDSTNQNVVKKSNVSTNQNVVKNDSATSIDENNSKNPINQDFECTFVNLKPIIRNIDDKRTPDDIPEKPSIYDVKSISNLPDVQTIARNFIEDDSKNASSDLKLRAKFANIYFEWLAYNIVNYDFISDLPAHSIDRQILLRIKAYLDTSKTYAPQQLIDLFKSTFKQTNSIVENDSANSTDKKIIEKVVEDKPEVSTQNVVEDVSATSEPVDSLNSFKLVPDNFEKLPCTFSNYLRPILQRFVDNRTPADIADMPSIYDVKSIANLPDVDPITRHYIENDLLDDEFYRPIHRRHRAKFANQHLHCLVISVANDTIINRLPKNSIDQIILRRIQYAIDHRDIRDWSYCIDLFKDIFRKSSNHHAASVVKLGQKFDSLKPWASRPPGICDLKDIKNLQCTFNNFEPQIYPMKDDRSTNDIPEKPSIYEVKSITNLPAVDPLTRNYIEDDSLNDLFHINNRFAQIYDHCKAVIRSIVNDEFIQLLPANSIDQQILRRIQLLLKDVDKFNKDQMFETFTWLFKKHSW